MTFIVGRRRTGKTTLILKAYKQNFVYLFVSKKSEPLLCDEFVSQIESGLSIKVHGQFSHFATLFEYLLELTKQYNLIGNYWERGNQNEIDIVAINEREKFALIAEVKLSSKRINLKELEHKARNLITQLPNYQIRYRGFSLDDMFDPSL